MSDKVSIQTDLEMIEWAGIKFDGEEIPIQLQRLMWAVRMQAMRIAWRDVYQIAAMQVQNYNVPLRPDANSSGSASPTSGAQAAPA